MSTALTERPREGTMYDVRMPFGVRAREWGGTAREGAILARVLADRDAGKLSVIVVHSRSSRRTFLSRYPDFPEHAIVSISEVER